MSPRAPASSPRQRAAAASADARSRRRVALEPAEQVLRRSQLAEHGDQRLDLVEVPRVPRPVRGSARPAGSPPAARAPHYASAGRRPNARAGRAPPARSARRGRPFVRAAAAAPARRGPAWGELAGDRVRERPQREQVRPYGGLACLLGQRKPSSAWRVTLVTSPRTQSIWAPRTSMRRASFRPRARRRRAPGSRTRCARSTWSHHSQVNAAWNSGRAITRALTAVASSSRTCRSVERALGSPRAASAAAGRRPLRLGSSSRFGPGGGRGMLDGLAQPLAARTGSRPAGCARRPGTRSRRRRSRSPRRSLSAARRSSS